MWVARYPLVLLRRPHFLLFLSHWSLPGGSHLGKHLAPLGQDPVYLQACLYQPGVDQKNSHSWYCDTEHFPQLSEAGTAPGRPGQGRTQTGTHLDTLSTYCPEPGNPGSVFCCFKVTIHRGRQEKLRTLVSHGSLPALTQILHRRELWEMQLQT